MKYMTPELLARVRSADDDLAEAAADEWERQGQEYRARLEEIQSRPDLPRGLRKLLKRDRLHDAKVLALATDQGKHFSMVLEVPWQTDPAKKYVELQSRLVGGLSKGFDLVAHEILKGDGKPFGWWLYDEIDVTDGKVEAYTHSILLTGGWELRLTFFALAWRRLEFLWLPTNHEGLVDPQEVERLRKVSRTLGACS
jgi:hypothetical protein